MIDPGFIRRVGQASAVILEMAVTVVLGVAAGAWLDSRFHTTPIFLLLLSMGALVLGMVRLTRSLKRFFTTDDGNPPHDQP